MKICSPSSLLVAACLSAFTLIACAANTESGDSSTSESATTVQTTLLVSDIDDTIKRTHVLDKAAAAVNALDSRDPFGGMRALYTRWHRENAPSKQIIYLSAAPGPLIELSKRFLTNSEFPGDTADVTESVVSGRSIFESAGDFKTKKLLEMYDAQVAAKKVPNTYILIGDNGEQDMIAYGNFIDYVRSKGGRTDRIYSFIHHVYDVPEGSPIAAPHRAWVTAGDLAVQLRELGLIGDPSLDDVLAEVATDVTHQAEVVVPSFMSCKQFSSWPYLETSAASNDYATVESDVKDLCLSE
ncbi:hypothetical protein AKJ09_05773 [Labilithrix luteola]|uniref:Phosphatidate phosphatase APP1 catalytic domain-containing protein n=1 Tax=Labilithrix luteola TaxID=1391654 RepID=A0A0K1Q119_9BACT|nr:phosphatase domain-containing protein [Labilithrix luteola]AKU99109.1 hypothetical protein AKJ09_05773 [Labilithrix luteola]